MPSRRSLAMPAFEPSGPGLRHSPPLILRSPEGASKDARWPDLCCNQPLPRTTGGVSWNALRGYASLRASGRGRWIARGVRNLPTRDRAPSVRLELGERTPNGGADNETGRRAGVALLVGAQAAYSQACRAANATSWRSWRALASGSRSQGAPTPCRRCGSTRLYNRFASAEYI